MHCRDCEHLERKNIDVWRCRLTGAHLSAEDLEADYPCPRDIGGRPERTQTSGVMEELMAYYEPKAPKMRAMWEEGATALEIALAVGCGKGIVENFIARFEREANRRGHETMDTAEKALEAGTPAPEGNGEGKPLTKDELYERIAEMRRRGAGWAEIQRQLGVNSNVVHAALERHGLLKKGIRRAKLEQEAVPEQNGARALVAEASFPATGGPPVVKVNYPPAPEAAPEKPRPLVAGLAKRLTAGAAAQYLRGIASSLELLPGRVCISVRVEEVSEHAQD